MGKCFLVRRGTATTPTPPPVSDAIYPIGYDGRPTGNVVVPNNVVSLHQYVFREDANVISIELPKDLRNLVTYDFYNCTNLRYINLPPKVQTIPANCFQGCGNLEHIDMVNPENNNITTIETNAFRDCASLDEFVFSSNLETIGTYAFSGCKAIRHLKFPQYFKEISTYTFQNNYYLQSITTHNQDNQGYDVDFPVSLTSIGNYAFENSFRHFSDGLKMKLHENLTSLGTNAFKNCISIKEISIDKGGNSLTLNNCCFSECTGLKRIELPATVTSSSYLTTINTNHILYNCSNLEEVILGKDWSVSINLSVSDKLTHDSMVETINNLADLTSKTRQTLTLGATNLAKLSDAEKAIATGKNWTLS